jgi:hypothetical protein
MRHNSFGAQEQAQSVPRVMDVLNGGQRGRRVGRGTAEREELGRR